MSESGGKKDVILVVDDTAQNIDVIKAILLPDYTIKAATSGELALRIVKQQPPDLILLDVMMPGMDGHEVCRQLKADPSTAKIPVIFATAMTATEDEELGFALGAVDYVTKPVTPAIVRARVKTHLALADQQREAERVVQRRTAELETSQKSAIFMLGEAGHYNDNDTGVHIWRMAAYCKVIAAGAGWNVERADLLELAAPMHDTGKIGIPDSILKAPRKLSDEEMAIMRTHTTIGSEILRKSDTPLFQLAAEIAHYHHERWDGKGYPEGLVGDAIPESARIVAIADVFDALSMKRPYKEPWPLEKTLALLRENAGSHFDPDLVAIFMDKLDDILEVQDIWRDENYPRDTLVASFSITA